MRIDFEYRDIMECGIGKEPWPDMCCCTCKFNKRVYNHCCHGRMRVLDDGCICNEELGFYVCIANEHPYVNLSGTHGGCEMHTPYVKEDDPLAR